MRQQKSFSEHEMGALYLVPTPIGNLDDMTFRAVDTLKQADLIACEDTRHTIKLCNHFQIETKLISYHEHSKQKREDELISELHLGKMIALVSDAGTPAISDPGYELVKRAIEEGIPVIPLPGANAGISALIASGLETQNFLFYGFLNRRKKEKRAELEKLTAYEATLIFYEAPHRLKETLECMYEQWGERRISICRELTKRHEEFIRGTLSEVLDWCEQGTVKGEFCLVVEGRIELLAAEEKWWEDLSIVQHVEHYLTLDMTAKEAIKQVAVERSLPKREVYATYHQ
ncbi:MAG TPA: 16S rRNA (cytidine(1402)-2'-O)-methyltransferase [Bacilli bacterium]|nr:16S rRNA (cytidine(1402)-2'-O)-methyltransferase [Bacilli bacterium]